MEEKGTSLYVELDDIIHSTDLDEVSAESSNTFDNLPDGYYLTEVIESKLTRSKSSDKPMVTLRLAVVGNGYNLSEDGVNFEPIENVAKRNLWKHYVIKDGNSFKRFVSDMLKFEGETPNEPMLPKEAWTDSTTLEASIGVLSQHFRRSTRQSELRQPRPSQPQPQSGKCPRSGQLPPRRASCACGRLRLHELLCRHRIGRHLSQ